MILIFGGAYQGKKEYAVKNYSIESEDILILSEEDRTLPDARAYGNFHEFTYGFAKRGESADEYLRENMESLKDKIIISDDISSGIVPVDITLRAWREMHGRCLNMLAAEADEVVRVFCGIGSRIK